MKFLDDSIEIVNKNKNIIVDRNNQVSVFDDYFNSDYFIKDLDKFIVEWDK